MVFALVLLCSLPAGAQPGAKWKVIQDAKGACKITVPPDWDPFGESPGAAVFHDPTTAIAVVTSQPEQAFKPLNAALLKALNIPKEKLFENSATRVFYQDKTSRNPDDGNAFTMSVPSKNGTCSCHVVAQPRSITEDVAKKIAESLAVQ